MTGYRPEISMREKWKTVAVVVEMKVRGDYSEKDLRWDVERALRGFTPTRAYTKLSYATGVAVVKEFGRVMTARVRNHAKG